MLRGRVKLACAGILLVLTIGVLPATGAELKLTRILDGLYVLPHGESINSNSVVIVTREGVVVVDTRVNPTEAKKLLAAIRAVTDQPVRFVVNSHFHGDYTFGNQVFRDTAAIIAHKNLRRSLADPYGPNHLNDFKKLKIPGLDEVKITLPNLVYEDKLELVIGGFRLQFLHLGRGHTDGDTAIFLQEIRTLIVGGLVSNQGIPYLGDAYIDDWISFLAKLEELDAEIVIPGQGEVGGKPVLIQMKHYLIDLRTLVQDQLARKNTLNDIKSAVHPILKEKYQSWKHQDWIDANIERAYQEYSGKTGLRAE